MIVSLEAIPRDTESLTAAAEIAGRFDRIGLINVPDLLRFSLRSWEACGILGDRVFGPLRTGKRPDLMPHLRAIDFDPGQPFPHTGYFRSHNIKKALVIAGDPAPQKSGKTRRFYPTETTAFIKKLRLELPELELYAAFDPYRSNIRYELDYLKAKEDAGASGFFSQPFFDLRLLEIYAEYLEGKNVFWGVSPVLTESSRGYWESRNRAIFPRSFRPDLPWNLDFGRRVLRFCETSRFNLYLMPIRIDLAPYLEGLFQAACRPASKPQ
ncbi:MAG: methylenetetrahydrofolate reductase [Treponema sp.]|jgi:methylenetetrahydrofolate reductase (NADPH)|nr:methylenetetrahydrofolate reductase [Treponema sp.]